MRDIAHTFLFGSGATVLSAVLLVAIIRGTDWYEMNHQLFWGLCIIGSLLIASGKIVFNRTGQTRRAPMLGATQ